jgi:YD repeat-containing protein
VPAGARATVLSYDGEGRLVGRTTATGPTVRARVVAGGFTLLRW